MLAWGLTHSVLRHSATGPRAPGAVSQGLYILSCAIAAGLLIAALYWAIRLPVFQASLYLRWLLGAAAGMICLILLTLLASLTVPGGPWARILRSSYLLSTTLLSLLLGWLLARDPFGLGRSSDRVYLTPSEVAALDPAERARLTLDSEDAPPGNG